MVLVAIRRFWCPFCKVIGNLEFFSCGSRYKLLKIAIKAVLEETPTNAYFRHYVIHHIAKNSKYTIHDIDYRREDFLRMTFRKKIIKKIDDIENGK